MDYYILSYLKVVDWGTPDAGGEVEDGIVPENPQVSSSQDEDEEPVTVKVNALYAVAVLFGVDTL